MCDEICLSLQRRSFRGTRTKLRGLADGRRACREAFSDVTTRMEGTMQALIESWAHAVSDGSSSTPALEPLVASDGQPQSDGALVAGRLLQPEGQIRIIAALPPIPVVSPEVQVPIDPQMEAARLE